MRITSRQRLACCLLISGAAAVFLSGAAYAQEVWDGRSTNIAFAPGQNSKEIQIPRPYISFRISGPSTYTLGDTKVCGIPPGADAVRKYVQSPGPSPTQAQVIAALKNVGSTGTLPPFVSAFFKPSARVERFDSGNRFVLGLDCRPDIVPTLNAGAAWTGRLISNCMTNDEFTVYAASAARVLETYYGITTAAQ